MPKSIDIPWPTSSAPGAHPQESGGRLINVTAEPLGDASPVKIVWRRQPGLSVFADLALSNFRGAILVNNLLYVAVGSKIVTVDSSGIVTVAGTLPGTAKVTFARNNAATPDIQCVSPGDGAFAVTSVSVTAFTGGGNLPSPTAVCGMDGYFFWLIGDNRIFAAGPNSTTVNSLTFVTMQSRPVGNALRVVPYQGYLFAFASKFIEVYSNTANTFPAFPFTRQTVIDNGLFGRNAIAGWEDGFGQLYWAAADNGVYRLNGTAPEKVSPPDLDRLITKIGAAGLNDQLEASSYQADGKSFIVFSCPSWTWEFNVNSQKWQERDSFTGGLASRWRATGAVNAFGKWLVGDQLTTKLLYIDPTTYQEVGTPMRFRMESAACSSFPNRAQVARADFNWITGVGISSLNTQTGNDPQVAISCSRDDGIHWDNPRLRKLGKAADGRSVYVTNCGMSNTSSQGFRWRMDMSDEVYGAFMGATMSSDIRAQ
jgi:hypothetical protein